MKTRYRISQCPNCKSSLDETDNFCRNCGQENHFYSNSLREIWNDFSGSFFNFDGKIWHTLITLFTKPGKVSKEYIEGKKASYVPPVRMYLFVSFLLFLTLNFLYVDVFLDAPGWKSVYESNVPEYSILNASIEKEVYDKNKNFTDKEWIEFILKGTKDADFFHKKLSALNSLNVIDSVNIEAKERSSSAQEKNDYKIIFFVQPKYDSLYIQGKAFSKIELKKIYENPKYAKEVVKKHATKGWFDKIIKTSLLQYYGVLFYGTPDFKKDFISGKFTTFLSNLSLAMFLVMPVSAFLFFVFFYKKYKHYYPHLILAIHLHVVLFLVIGFITGIDVLVALFSPDLGGAFYIVAIILTIIYMIYYLISSVKHFYQKSLLSSIFNGILLGIIYLVQVIVVFVTLVMLLFMING